MSTTLSRAGPHPDNFYNEISRDQQQQILTAVQNFMSLKGAARFARVSYARLTALFAFAAQTLNDPDFHPDDYTPAELALIDFYQSVEAAAATAERDAVMSIKEASAADWKAAAHLLKHRNPSDWAENPASSSSKRSNETAIEPADPSAAILNSPKLDLRRLNADELIELRRLLLKATTNPSHPSLADRPSQPAALPLDGPPVGKNARNHILEGD